MGLKKIKGIIIILLLLLTLLYLLYIVLLKPTDNEAPEKANYNYSIKDILRTIGIKEGIALKRVSVETLYQFVSKETVVKDVMHPPISITLDKRFPEAIQMMLSYGYEEIAVVDNEGKVIGDLNAFEIISNMTIENDKREES